MYRLMNEVQARSLTQGHVLLYIKRTDQVKTCSARVGVERV